jgi:hypothetical protein
VSTWTESTPRLRSDRLGAAARCPRPSDLEEERLQAFWLRSLDLLGVTRHYLREVVRDAWTEDPRGNAALREQVYNDYDVPLWQAGGRITSHFDEAPGQPLTAQSFEWGVRALEVTFACPLFQGPVAADVPTRVAAVRRRQQLAALAPRAESERAGDEALDAALQASIDAERAREGADRIEEIREELEEEWLEVEPRGR